MEKQTIRNRLIKLGIFLSFFLCYLEWGTGNSGFMLQMELAVFSENATSDSFMHPFIFFPLAGQLLLLLSLVLPRQNRRLTIAGILMLGLLVLMVLLVGLLSVNIKIIVSTIPFIAFSVYYIFFYNRIKSAAQTNQTGDNS